VGPSNDAGLMAVRDRFEEEYPGSPLRWCLLAIMGYMRCVALFTMYLILTINN
jgi:hypothetical protein